MNKINKETLNIKKEHIEKLKELFPSIVTDGKIDFDQLKTILGQDIDESNERYQFSWNGKKDAIKLAQSASTGTLRPSIEDSVNWDSTENMYIEGDNLEVLKQLQKTYFGKIKMIYIDPPYNTGGDFVYKDNFRDSIKNYKEVTNQQLRSNPETSGRYHTDWLNMMYPRLMLARNLLTEDGVIFVSIDDNEVENLKKIMSEIFGDSNFITSLIWKSKNGGGNDAKFITVDKEYILVYSKNGINLEQFYDLEYQTSIKYNLQDEKGNYTLDRLDKKALGYVKSLDFEIKDKNGNSYFPEQPDLINPSSRWRWSKKTVEENYESLVFKNGYVYTKAYEKNGAVMRDLLVDTRHKRSQDGTKEVKEIFGGRAYFSFPKPLFLLLNIFNSFLSTNGSINDIILDFFSGSATTAHAVMKLNAEDGGDRKFIMVQLPEKTDESSEAYKAGYENICEIGKERIRRAGKQIKEELEKEGKETSSLDIGFKVFKLDDTNIKAWDAYADVSNETLFSQESILKDGRTKQDLLYEILLKYGVFDKKVNTIKVNQKTMYRVGENSVIIDLNDAITLDDVRAIATLKPMTVIFYEDGFEDDNVKINAEVILKDHGVEDVRSI
jgi:adenine-specific DNA-methyltransferase